MLTALYNARCTSSYLDTGQTDAVELDGVAVGAEATNIILPSAVFTQPWASMICVGGEYYSRSQALPGNADAGGSASDT